MTQRGETLKFDSKVDGLTVHINWRGNAAINLAKNIRTKLNIPKGDITTQIMEMFNCTIEKDCRATVYSFTFTTERDMMYFILHL